MPVVSLRIKQHYLPVLLAKKLPEAIPEIVSPALGVRPNDIEVHVDPANELDINTKDVELMVWAHDFPERLHNVGERANMVRDALREFIGDHDGIAGIHISGWVWILLAPSGFSKI